jgi:beta-N-acetylhexosaminidase
MHHHRPFVSAILQHLTSSSGPLTKHLAILLGIIILTTCARSQHTSVGADAPTAGRASAQVDSTLRSMSLEEQVGQVVMAGAYGHFISSDTDEYYNMLRLVRDQHLGGIIMFQGDVYATAEIINKLQHEARIPLLVAADFERGVAMRLRRGTYFPDAMAIGATRNPEYAYAVGRAIAVEGRAIGIHQNYAPVADVNTNPDNPVINTRSFSEDPLLVAQMAEAFARGTNDGGMIATAKHFPGHGDTGVDSHLSLPVVTAGRTQLDSLDLMPFRSVIGGGVMSIMVGHLSVPSLDATPGLPATLSPPVVSDLLEHQLGFEGLVVTDAMGMRGVTRGFSVSDAAIRAFNAGVDIILMPPDDEIALRALLAAVRAGTISRDRLRQSVRKVLQVKEMLGLTHRPTVNLDRIADSVSTRAHQLLALNVARDAITLLKNDAGLLPLQPWGEKKIVSVVINDTDDNLTAINRPENPWTVEPAGSYFHQLLRRRRGYVETYTVSPGTGSEEMHDILTDIKSADIVLVPTFVKVRTSSGKIGTPPNVRRFLEDLAGLDKQVVAVSFGSPYVMSTFPHAQALMCAYADAEVIVQAAVEALFGEIDVHGKLPVTVSDEFRFGTGLDLPQVNLRPDDPAAAGFNPEKLLQVDHIVTRAIRDSAFPGAQVAILKDGMLVCRKSFGTYTYDASSREIDNNTIFDLASLTKVIATTTAIMKLYDEWKLLLTDPVGKYIPQFSTGPKSAITIQHLLTHTSGLKPFLKLYDVCRTPEETMDSIYASTLIARPGDSTIYSDLGVITLGKVVEAITGSTLDEYVASTFFRPLGMRRTMFNPQESMWSRAAPTEIDTVWRMRLVQGTVHDERAALLNGVAGHAGLFSTASDLAVFMQMIMNKGEYGGVRYLKSSTVDMFTRRYSEASTRALGWDTKSPTHSSAGNLFSLTSFGHTGFTGTSIWADPERNLVVIFLTNRVYPTRANGKIFAVRPALHDAVINALRPPGHGAAAQ